MCILPLVTNVITFIDYFFILRITLKVLITAAPWDNWVTFKLCFGATRNVHLCSCDVFCGHRDHFIQKGYLSSAMAFSVIIKQSSSKKCFGVSKFEIGFCKTETDKHTTFALVYLMAISQLIIPEVHILRTDNNNKQLPSAALRSVYSTK